MLEKLPGFGKYRTRWKVLKMLVYKLSFPGSPDGKMSARNAGDLGSIPGSGRSPGEGNGNPFQYSCLENPMDGGVWWATVHGVAKSRTRLSDFTFFLFFLSLQLAPSAAAAAKSLQWCPTLCDHMDSSPPGSPVHRIL